VPRKELSMHRPGIGRTADRPLKKSSYHQRLEYVFYPKGTPFNG